MSTLTTNAASRASTGHRARVMADAVVSAYIHEISVPQRPSQRPSDLEPALELGGAAARQPSAQPSTLFAPAQVSSSVTHPCGGRRARTRVLSPRRPALELGA